MFVMSICVILFSLFLIYEFVGAMFGFPVVYNLFELTNTYFIMAQGVVFKWSIFIGVLGIFVGILSIVHLKYSKVKGFTNADKRLIISYFIVGIISVVILII